MTRIYKILGRAEWEAALARGVFEGSAVDLADGFIHLSAADQATETARRWFRGQPSLIVLTLDTEAFGPELRWEPSRGGALFPHLYGPLDCDMVVEARDAPLGDDNIPILGRLAP